MDVRALFLDYFKSKGHVIYPSMPLFSDDPTLLFTNAGMVQFKDIFTGKIPAPTTPRAVSSQLCIRAGGKHNDLENVGYTARHHTLFEMLGNFSFGDYFKREAIAFGWEFVTKILGFDKSVLYITIHDSDDEAYELWCEHVEPSRIKRMGDKDNFWQMGDSGPCGPCSEIYVDQGERHFNTSEDYFGGDGDRFLEIWNLVFMQYEQKDGVRTPLPKPSIDTGMGLERVVALLEGRINNFDTSLFAPLMDRISELTGMKYYRDDEVIALEEEMWSLRFDSKNEKNTKSDFLDSMSQDSNVLDSDFLESARHKLHTPPYVESIKKIKSTQASFRVIADHARSVAFLLAQGVYFDKEGRGYVLRRILRRAVRHGYLLGLKEAFLYKILEVVCECMSESYGYLLDRKDSIKQQCKAEEERFFETIENGMNLFSKELDSMLDIDSRRGRDLLTDNKALITDGLLQDLGHMDSADSKNSKNSQDSRISGKRFFSDQKTFSGEVAFKLYDTFGFPLDLTQDMLREYGLSVDVETFEKEMQKQRQKAKSTQKFSTKSLDSDGDFKEILARFERGEIKNEFVGYESFESDGVIVALLDSDFRQTDTLEGGQEGYIMLDKTPLYPESGGPVGDRGVIIEPLVSKSGEFSLKGVGAGRGVHKNDENIESDSLDSLHSKPRTPSTDVLAKITDTKKYFGLNISQIKAIQTLKVTQRIRAVVDSSRLEITKHHSATHLLHLALRDILGSHITQAGSLVEATRLRFDFSHPQALSSEELEKIEALVNKKIAESSNQVCEIMELDMAKKRGAMALFGEKYADNVRVISFGESIELCGGIHVQNTAMIGSFYITKESGVSSGVRRIEAVCGVAAYRYGRVALDSIKMAKAELKSQDLMQGIKKLKSGIRAECMRDISADIRLDYEMIGKMKVVISRLDSGVSIAKAKELVDRAKNENESVAIMLFLKSDSKKDDSRISIVAGVSGAKVVDFGKSSVDSLDSERSLDSKDSKKSLKANEWVKKVATKLGGNGGGKEDFATAGVRVDPADSARLDEMLQMAMEYAKECMV